MRKVKSCQSPSCSHLFQVILPKYFLTFKARVLSVSLFLVLTCTAFLLLATWFTGTAIFDWRKFLNTQSDVRTLVVQQESHYEEHRNNPKSYSDMLILPRRGNWGDCLWEWAGEKILDHDRIYYCKNERQKCVERFPDAKRIVHYYPCANDLFELENFHITHGTPYTLNWVTRSISTFGEPFFLLGLGTQGNFSHKHSSLRTTPTMGIGELDYTLGQPAQNMLRALQEHRQPVFLRGSFTNSVAKRYGYTYGRESGCPTLMINTEVHLGRVLQKRYDDISQRVGDRSLKVAININRERSSWDFALRILDLYPNSLVFAQGPNDVYCMQKRNVSFDRMRFFEADVPAWLDALKDMDVAIGPRIHGNMAAFAATPPIPIYVMAPDYRVLELVEAMQVPFSESNDKRFVNPNIDIAELFRDASFDGEAFDRNRCRLAKIYKQEFDKVGMHLAKHVQEITQLC